MMPHITRKPVAATVTAAVIALTGFATQSMATDAVPEGAVKANLTINLASTKLISDTMFGVFFEDINYGADGGLYAELVRNRDFEFSAAIGDDRNWNAKTAWSLKGTGTSFDTSVENPISVNNKNYAVLTTTEPGASLINEGFGGICVKEDAKYDFSVFAKNFESTPQTLLVKLIDENGKDIGSETVTVKSGEWTTLTATIEADANCDKAQLSITPEKKGKVGLDMVSLFPQDTFKGRKNGLRKDLAQAIADLKPTFVRFPGGCVAHGDLPRGKDGKIHSGLVPGERGKHDVYYWSESVGKLEDRVPIHNRWGYHQTRGLGYYEYFLFCEDIGAHPLPILSCGVDCQFGGGQQAVPMEEMKYIVDEALNLVEFANGPVTTKWGKLRAEMGHPKPFNLKYLGLGNEEAITDAFRARFKMVFDELKKKCPEIIVVGTVGPGASGNDFNNGWNFARQENIPIVDEHFYMEPNWFVDNGYHRYDKYERGSVKVYAGEYAAHERGQRTRRNTVETALDEAVFLAGVERNGDVVVMTSYAPLVHKEGNTQWYPDMIPFNNKEVKSTTTYEVQKLFGNNAGVRYVTNQIRFDEQVPADFERKMVASVVRDGKDGQGDVIIKLVNVTEKAFDMSVDLTNIIGSLSNVGTRTTITGTWNSTQYSMTNDEVALGRNFKVVCQPRSMSVIRIRAK